MIVAIPRTFQTNVDIWLRDWVENSLPKASIETGLQTLYNQLDSKLKTMKDVPGYDPVFDPLKVTVHQEIRKRHHWDPKAESRLVSLSFLCIFFHIYI